MKILKKLLPYIIILIVVILIRTFIVTPVRVSGVSMAPTLNNKDIMILNKIASIERLSIIVIDYNGEQLIKRIIGLPGETISIVDNEIIINNKILTSDIGVGHNGNLPEVTLAEREYFVMGDNRTDSKDSRYFGPVNRDEIRGATSFVIFPFNNFGLKK